MSELFELVGKLKIVASTCGVQIEGTQGWINPTKEAKTAITPKLEQLKALKGKDVRLLMVDEKTYQSIEVFDDTMVPEEEIITDNPTETKPQQQPAKEPIKTPTTPAKPNIPTNTPVNYFTKLQAIQCTTEKKLNLTYISWAEAWGKLKERHPEAEYEVHENKEGMPYFTSPAGAMVKVTVKVLQYKHTIWMPVLDHSNKPIKPEQVTTFNINTSIQRALAKAIALHGLGLYVYQGEDMPKEEPKGE